MEMSEEFSLLLTALVWLLSGFSVSAGLLVKDDHDEVFSPLLRDHIILYKTPW